MRHFALAILGFLLLWHPQVDTTTRIQVKRVQPAQDTLATRPDTLRTPKADSLALSDQVSPAAERPLRVVANTAWNVGEELTFSLRYGPVLAGSATFAVRDTVRLNGSLCYHIRAEAQTNRVFSSIYRVRDVAESFVDVRGIFPWRFDKHLREGKYRADRITMYDQHRNLAVTGKDTLKVPPFVQDVISMVYFLRTQPLAIGDTLSVPNHADRKVYDLKVAIHRRERVRVAAGVFDCLVVEPFLLDGSGVFKHEGRILVWMSEDSRRIPVQLKSKVVVGTVTAELEQIRGAKKT
ncbi:MAG: DUF3108 domain-containing protein [bacterium]|jgi:hypothetical protein|nr:DUF3108 domain-containing protein [candidate division KSB1 bacterium]MDH7560688.1 DUF3108 domain-containing protein [bacterium]